MSLTSVQLYSYSCPLVAGDFVGFIDGDIVGNEGEVIVGGGVGVSRDTDEGCDTGCNHDNRQAGQTQTCRCCSGDGSS